jgi:hypothetical protein
MSKSYKDRKEFDAGGGSGTYVTNAYNKNTANHSMDFYFMHCCFMNLRGTALVWHSLYFAISEDFIDYKELEKYTDEQCFELVLQHISAGAMMECISKISMRVANNSVSEFKRKLRELIF